MAQGIFRLQSVRPPSPLKNRYSLPGYGLPLDFCPMSKDSYGTENRSLFPSALYDRDIDQGYINLPLTTLRELTMVKLIDEFTDLPQWTEKVHDDLYVDEWKRDVRSRKGDTSEKMLDWVVEELRFKTPASGHAGAIGLYNGDIVKSDSAISETLRRELNIAIKPLQESAQKMKVYQGPDEWEVELVNPSVFPLVFGRSRILRNSVVGREDAIRALGHGDIIAIPTDPEMSHTDMNWRISSRADINVKPYSLKYQWLPCDVLFKADGTCYIASYINNVHPEIHKEFYCVTEQILDSVVPLWDLTLTAVIDMLSPGYRIEYRQARYHPLSEELKAQSPQQKGGETELEFEDRYSAWRTKVLDSVQPEPGRFVPVVDQLQKTQKSRVTTNIKGNYGERGLQVIFKAVNIILTPDKTRFETDWQVEGQMNEHICAGALYFFDNENITDPCMAFRQVSDTESIDDINNNGGNPVWLKQVFGLENNKPAVQEVGPINCKQNRVVTWPNIVQHRFLPFGLKDPTSRGHCKMLKLLLVDPNIRIISTANVPPQRLDWKDNCSGMPNAALENLSIGDREKKPPGGQNEGFPFTMEDAREFLRGINEERKVFNGYQNVAFHSRYVSV